MRASPALAILQTRFTPLTEGEWRRVKAHLDPLHPGLADDVLGDLARIIYDYKTCRNMIENWPEAKLTRRRMFQIQKTARKLMKLLTHEFFEYRLMNGPHTFHDPAGDFVGGPTVFLDILRNVEHESVAIATGTGPCVRPLTRKSPERFLLWDPLIALWAKADRVVGYSEGGPLESFISTVQILCGGVVPSGPSIRVAVQAWKAKNVSEVKGAEI